MCFGSAPKIKPVKTPTPPPPPEAPPILEIDDKIKKNRKKATSLGTNRLRIPTPPGGNVNLG